MKILNRTKVEISLKDLAQISPAARKHWKHDMSRVNDKRSRRKRRQAEFSEVALKLPSEETQTIGSKKETRASPLEKSAAPQHTITYKSFEVSEKLKTAIAGKKKIVVLDINSTPVNQGTDLNLISDYLAKTMKFQTIKLPKPIFFAWNCGGKINKCYPYYKDTNRFVGSLEICRSFGPTSYIRKVFLDHIRPAIANSCV
ncbi:hypothetical protein OnM2_097028 [Erysiphe neolycopersici]|uniref:Uncharacterized protein n=1 Tax=Erysiphe neolycopersici TaxID=212602 RepID=A0A420HAN6_9PEZI|nr:hypothetical protein OnM2_097028 [Erysiphe neolycopersici]